MSTLAPEHKKRLYAVRAAVEDCVDADGPDVAAAVTREATRSALDCIEPEKDAPCDCGRCWVCTTGPKRPGGDPPVFDDLDVTEHRLHDATRLLKYVIDNPTGVRLSECVKAVLPDADTADQPINARAYSSTDYTFARDFFERSEYAELLKESGSLWVEPTAKAFHLTTVMQISNRKSSVSQKQRAEGYIANISGLHSPKNARKLCKEFAQYLESIEDRRVMLSADGGPDLTMPWATRFTSEHRKDETWAKYHHAWDKATKEFDTGLLLTLTTDPKRFDSIAEMVDGLFDAWKNLLELLNQRYDESGRVKYIRALEFGGSEKSSHPGLPHLHVMVFDLRYLDASWLSDYWASKGQGEIVHVDRVNLRGNQFLGSTPESDSKRNAKAYLAKYMSKIMDASHESTASDIFDTIEHWDSDADRADWVESPLWKVALYWVTGRSVWDCSHSLKPETKPDTLEEVSGLGETKLEILADHGINTWSDVRLATESELKQIAAEADGLGVGLVLKLNRLAGEPNRFDAYSFEFVGAANPKDMPGSWQRDAVHIGIGKNAHGTDPPPGSTA